MGKLLYFFIAWTIGLTGCVHKRQYEWGSYQDHVNASLRSLEGGDPASQLASLTSDLERIKASGKPVPPGFYAHLGFMQHLSGNDAEAILAFEKEMSIYPSSKKFMQRLIDNLQGKANYHGKTS